MSDAFKNDHHEVPRQIIEAFLNRLKSNPNVPGEVTVKLAEALTPGGSVTEEVLKKALSPDIPPS